MSDVLSAADVAKRSSYAARSFEWRQPLVKSEDEFLQRIWNLAEDVSALARSHEQLRGELREAEIATYDALAMLGEARAERDAAVQIAEMRRQERDDLMDATKAWTMRADRAETAARAGGCAADALREIVTYYETSTDPVFAYEIARVARDALSAYDRAVSGQTTEKEEA